MSGIMPRHGHAVIYRVGFCFLAHFLTVLTTTNTITLIKEQDSTVGGKQTAFPPSSRVVLEACLRRPFPTSSYTGIK